MNKKVNSMNYQRRIFLWIFSSLFACFQLSCGQGNDIPAEKLQTLKNHEQERNKFPDSKEETPIISNIPIQNVSGSIALSDLPHILWEERESYEKEGTHVFFTNCGLYKGETDELTGAICEFDTGEWGLVSPKFEPHDNLFVNVGEEPSKRGHIPLENTNGLFLPNIFVKRNNSGKSLLTGRKYQESLFPYCIDGEFEKGSLRITVYTTNINLPAFQNGGVFTVRYTVLHESGSAVQFSNLVSIYTRDGSTNRHKYLKPDLLSESQDLMLYRFILENPDNLYDLKFVINAAGSGKFRIQDLLVVRGFIPFELS